MPPLRNADPARAAGWLDEPADTAAQSDACAQQHVAAREALSAQLLWTLAQAVLEDAAPSVPPAPHAPFDLLGPREPAQILSLRPVLCDRTGDLLGEGPRLRAEVRARGEGCWAGLAGVCLAADLARAWIGADLDVELLARDGQRFGPGSAAAVLSGPARAVLLLERSLLNTVQFLSGIASATARCVAAADGTPAKICDTRKTVPGHRLLSKYAVRCGGGVNHRMGLHDAVLVKDNHLATLPAGVSLGAWLAPLVEAARRLDPPTAFVEVEVDSLAQLGQVLPVPGVDMVLLDNFSLADLATAVALRNRLRPGVLLECSGQVTLDRVRAIAETGVDRISIGAITHSAPAADIGLDHAEERD